jgi:hypothetical protein
VDHAAGYEKRFARAQVGALPADGKSDDAVKTENSLVEVVVAVRRGHACIRGNLALENADTAVGLICVDVKTNA